MDFSNGTLIGYARISTDQQSIDLQIDALKRAGVTPDDIYTDEMSSRHAVRPSLEKAMRRVREDVTLVVWRLDRLARDAVELDAIAKRIQAHGGKLRSLTEHIDTSSAIGKVTFQMLAAFAEFERNLISERTLAGLRAAAERGRKGGARRRVTPEMVAEINRLLAEDVLSITEICEKFKISKPTLYGYVKGGREGIKEAQRAAKAA